MLPWRSLTERSGVELERCRQIGYEIGPIMAAGVNMELVAQMARFERPVQRLRTGIEAVVVLRAAVEIDRHLAEVRRPRHG